MLRVELISLGRLCEFTHFKFRNTETARGNCIQDLTSLSVTVRFDHSEGPPGLFLERLLRENISVIDQLQLSRVDVDQGSNE